MAKLTIREKILRCLNIGVIAVALVLVFASLIIGKFEATKLLNSYEIETWTPWTLSDANGAAEVCLPYKCSLEQGQTISLTRELPEEMGDGYAIMFRNGYNAIEIYANGDLLYSYGEKLPLPYGRMTGNIQIIVEIPSEYAGTTLEVRQIPYYSVSSSLTQIYYGKTDALKLEVVFSSIWRCVVAVSLFTICFICMGISLAHFVRKAKDNSWAFYHLGCFMAYIGVWFICSSDIPQLITDANEVVSLCSFMALAIIPIHVVAFSAEMIPDRRDMFRYIQIIQWLVPIAIMVGFVTNLWDPVEILILTHISLVFAIVYSTIKGYIGAKNNAASKKIAIANSIFVFFMIGALIAYYVAPTSGFDAVVVGFGLVFYTYYLLSVFMTREAEIISESRRKDIYRELAYKDIQTGLFNRGAFSHDMAEIGMREILPAYVDMIVMDLNYLKKTNDTYGHLEGDKLIEAAADCIAKAFSDIGSTYRVGGDEFAVIILDHHELIAERFEKFEKLISSYNEQSDMLTLSISFGVASEEFSSDSGFLEKMYSRADKAMYRDKIQKHRVIRGKDEK